MIKFISTPNKDRPYTFESDYPELTIEISTQDKLTIAQFGNMLVSFLRAIGFHDSLIERFSSEYNPCEGCEYISESENEKENKLVWTPSPDGDGPDNEIEGIPV